MTVAPIQSPTPGQATPRLDLQATAAVALAAVAAKLSALTSQPVTPATPAAESATVDETVRAAAQRAVVRQGSLAPLLADLEQAAGNPDLPPPVQTAIRQVLALRTRTDPPPTAADVKQALARSGLFLEAKLPTAAPSARPAAQDLKAALLVLRQVLSAWAGPPPAAPQGAAPPQPVAVAPQAPLQIEAEAAAQGAPVLPAAPDGEPPVSSTQSGPAPLTPRAATPAPPASSATPEAAPFDAAPPTPAQTPPAQGARTLGQPPAQPPVAAATARPPVAAPQTPPPAPLPEAHTPASLPAQIAEASRSPPSAAPDRPAPPQPDAAATLPPPYRNGPTRAQPPEAPGLPAQAAPAVLAQRLLHETDAALARQELHQLASLPLASDAVGGGRVDGPKWMFEVPFATPQGSAVAQFEISRDGGGGETYVGAGTAVWSARFSFDMEPMGPVHAHVTLTGAKAGVTLWAEREPTVARLRAQEESLNAALRTAAFEPEVAVRPGAPPRAAPTPAPGQFVDRAT
jgi:hypothetical protein